MRNKPMIDYFEFAVNLIREQGKLFVDETEKEEMCESET